VHAFHIPQHIKRPVMYMCIRGVEFVFVSPIGQLYVVSVPTVCYFPPLFIIFTLLPDIVRVTFEVD
jgi:hypothetical protein